MIDTIRISSIVSQVKDDQFDAEIRTIDQKTGEIKTKLITKSGVRLTYYPNQNKGILLAEVSLPKLVKGNNYELLNQDGITQGLGMMEDRINEVCSCAAVSSWHVSRLDSVMSWPMGDKLQDYIKYFRTLPVAGYTLTGYTKDKKEIGSSWIAYSRRINGYDKDTETGQDHGGLLRLEVQDRNSASVRTLAKRLKVKQLVKNIITEDVARSEVKRWLERARVEDYIKPEDEILETLIKEYGSQASEMYFFYAAYKKYGENTKIVVGYSESTFRRQRRAIKSITDKTTSKVLLERLQL